MYGGYPERLLDGKQGMMSYWGNWQNNPYVILAVVYHIAVALLVLAIMYLVAAYLWEKVKKERKGR